MVTRRWKVKEKNKKRCREKASKEDGKRKETLRKKVERMGGNKYNVLH